MYVREYVREYVHEYVHEYVIERLSPTDPTVFDVNVDE